MQPRNSRTLTISEDESLSGPPLDVLADVWSNRRSGWLKVGVRRAAICQGGIINEAGGELVDLALALSDGGGTRAFVMAAEVRFEPHDHEGLPDTLSVARAIWHAAVKEADPTFTDAVLHRVLRRTDQARLADQLPLSEPVRTLLNAPANRLVSRHLKNLEIAPYDVGRELAALVRMGLIRFQRVHKVERTPAAGEVVQPRKPQRSRAENVEYMLLLRRLRREAAALDEASDWTILGIPPGSPPEQIRAAGERMIKRYGGLSHSIKQPEEVRQLAARILARVEKAVEGLAYAPAAGGDPVEEEAFRLGRVAMDEGRVADAVRHFAAARARTPDSPRNLAWLGWAVFWDESRPADIRKAEALELLQVAAQFDEGEAPEPAYFLAHLEADRGDIGMAEARLSRMLRQHPDHQRGKRLFLQVRRRRSMTG